MCWYKSRMQLMHAHTSGISIRESGFLNVCEKITHHVSDTREEAGFLVWGEGRGHLREEPRPLTMLHDIPLLLVNQESARTVQPVPGSAPVKAL